MKRTEKLSDAHNQWYTGYCRTNYSPLIARMIGYLGSLRRHKEGATLHVIRHDGRHSYGRSSTRNTIAGQIYCSDPDHMALVGDDCCKSFTGGGYPYYPFARTSDCAYQLLVKSDGVFLLKRSNFPGDKGNGSVLIGVFEGLLS